MSPIFTGSGSCTGNNLGEFKVTEKIFYTGRTILVWTATAICEGTVLGLIRWETHKVAKRCSFELALGQWVRRDYSCLLLVLLVNFCWIMLNYHATQYPSVEVNTDEHLSATLTRNARNVWATRYRLPATRKCLGYRPSEQEPFCTIGKSVVEILKNVWITQSEQTFSRVNDLILKFVAF